MKQILIILFASIISFNLFADSKQSMIEVGNNFYANGDFNKAIEQYEEVLATGYEAAHLYFNLGNADYKTGQIPSAILNYERAKILAPNDEDIQFNLELSNTHIVDKLEVIPAFFAKRWLHWSFNYFSSNEWAFISIGGFFLFLISLLLFLYSRKSFLRRSGFYAGMLILIFTVYSMLASSYQKNQLVEDHSAIVFSPSVTVKSSPDESGTDLFLLHEGSKVSLIDKLGDWVEIRLSDGNEGWMESRHIEVI